MGVNAAGRRQDGRAERAAAGLGLSSTRSASCGGESFQRAGAARGAASRSGRASPARSAGRSTCSGSTRRPTAPAIKAQYKALVKRFHPDANGGDRSFEERLRDIIKAHDTLKTAGLC